MKTKIYIVLSSKEEENPIIEDVYLEYKQALFKLEELVQMYKDEDIDVFIEIYNAK